MKIPLRLKSHCACDSARLSIRFPRPEPSQRERGPLAFACRTDRHFAPWATMEIQSICCSALFCNPGTWWSWPPPISKWPLGRFSGKSGQRPAFPRRRFPSPVEGTGHSSPSLNGAGTPRQSRPCGCCPRPWASSPVSSSSVSRNEWPVRSAQGRNRTGRGKESDNPIVTSFSIQGAAGKHVGPPLLESLVGTATTCPGIG